MSSATAANPLDPGKFGAGSRIPLFSADDMTQDQETVYRAIIAGPRTEVVGPLRAVLHIPELADRWQRFGEFLRFDTGLPTRLNELAILTTARRWNAIPEWDIHARVAAEAGLGVGVIAAIRDGAQPFFDSVVEREIYDFARSLQLVGNVPDHVYHAVWRRWGTQTIVELSSVIGYYTLVAMTLNVHQVPRPTSAEDPMPVPAVDPGGIVPLSGLPPSSGHIARTNDEESE